MNDALVVALVLLVAAWLLLGRAGRPAGRSAVQAEHLTIDTIADGVVAFTDGRWRAVIEVGSVNFAALGEAKQRELVLGYAAVVDGLAYPVQILVRAVPHDLTPYLTAREARARHEPHERLRRLNRDRNAFVRRLAAGHSFLDRRFYLVVPADDPCPTTRLRPTRLPVVGHRRATTEALATAAIRQLAARCDDLAQQLIRCGLTARRLDDGELAALHYACWCPDLARVQRLRDDLRDYQRLVVTRADRAAGGTVQRRVP